MSCNDLGARYQKYVRGLFLLLLLLSTVSGCTGEAPSTEPVTITVAYEGPVEYYEPLIQEFNKSYPHITVELDNSGGDDNIPDVLMITSFDLSELLDESAILSLDPFIEQDESFDLADFYVGTIELCSREGRIWAVPTDVIVRVLYYNQDLFDAYGVSYPESGWTWDDFLDKSLALRDPEADVFAYAETNSFVDSIAFVYQHGGRIADDMQNPTRTTFDDPLTIEALEWYAALIHEHNVALTESDIYDVGGSLHSGVYLGQIGMWTGWFAERGGGGGVEYDWPAEWKMRWGMVPLPRDAQSATLAFIGGYAISAQSTHPEASWQWIKFLSEQTQTPYNMTPARKSLVESNAYEQLVGSDAANTARLSMESAVLLTPAVVELVPFYVYGTALDAITNGRSTPAEAMSRAQQQAEQ